MKEIDIILNKARRLCYAELAYECLRIRHALSKTGSKREINRYRRRLELYEKEAASRLGVLSWKSRAPLRLCSSALKS